MLVLFTDTDTDITPELVKEYDYHLISMPLVIEDRTIYPYVDFETFDSKEYYARLRNGLIPTTCALNEQEYIDYFEPVFAAGDNILYVHFSGQMSSTFETMNLAVEKLKAKYPERKFYSIDTKSISLPACSILCEIGELYKAGKTAEEIIAWADRELQHFAAYFFVDNLNFLKHSGRLGGLSGVMGTLLGIRPIIYISAEGKLVNIGKEKGKNRAIEALVDKVAELGDHIEEHRIILGSSDARELAEELGQRIEERLGKKLKFDYMEIGPVVGGHAGPDTVAVSFYAKHR